MRDDYYNQYGIVRLCQKKTHSVLKRIHIDGCRYNERLNAKTEGSKHLTYTGLNGELEHLMIETRLIDESFECVMGECVI